MFSLLGVFAIQKAKIFRDKILKFLGYWPHKGGTIVYRRQIMIETKIEKYWEDISVDVDIFWSKKVNHWYINNALLESDYFTIQAYRGPARRL